MSVFQLLGRVPQYYFVRLTDSKQASLLTTLLFKDTAVVYVGRVLSMIWPKMCRTYWRLFTNTVTSTVWTR